jgi:hypothetical protein
VSPHSGGGRGTLVVFVDDLFEVDLQRVGGTGRAALRAARRRMERDGLGPEDRWECRAEHASGTDLPGCMKTYVPRPGGRWRMVFQVTRLPDGRLALVFVAAGVGHLPGGLRRDVYAIAHHRLHGYWPARRTR